MDVISMNNLECHNIKEKLINIIINRLPQWTFYDNDASITEQTHIRKDLGLDSISLVIMQIELEDAFQIRFDTTREDFREVFSTVGALSECIVKHIEEQQNEQ